jgi:large subunit ribosomal protein L35
VSWDLAKCNATIYRGSVFIKKRALQRRRKPVFSASFPLISAMQKTRKSIAKRFKKTGTGKLLRRTPGHRHLLRNKSVKQRRRAGTSKLVADGQRADLIRALPFA